MWYGCGGIGVGAGNAGGRLGCSTGCSTLGSAAALGENVAGTLGDGDVGVVGKNLFATFTL